MNDPIPSTRSAPDSAPHLDPRSELVVPDGYQLHTRRSPLTEPWEPIFARETDAALQLAVQIRKAHCNSRGFAHGGLISSLADNAMGLSVVRMSRQRPGAEDVRGLTASLSVDFIDVAQVGIVLEFHPNVLKLGRNLAFVECRVVCAERLIARANASFRIV